MDKFIEYDNGILNLKYLISVSRDNITTRTIDEKKIEAFFITTIFNSGNGREMYTTTFSCQKKRDEYFEKFGEILNPEITMITLNCLEKDIAL